MLIPVNRVEGLTRAVVAPSPGDSLIAGQGGVIHLGDRATTSWCARPAAMFAVLGEEGPSHAGGGARRRPPPPARGAPGRRATTPPTAPPSSAASGGAYALSRLDLEALLPVVRGELPLVVAVRPRERHPRRAARSARGARAAA